MAACWRTTGRGTTSRWRPSRSRWRRRAGPGSPHSRGGRLTGTRCVGARWWPSRRPPCSLLTVLVAGPHGARRVVAAGVVWFVLGPAAALAQTTTQVVEYYTTDAIGSVRAVTKQVNGQWQVVTRHDFMPFGEEVAPPSAAAGQAAVHGEGTGQRDGDGLLRGPILPGRRRAVHDGRTRN